MDNKQRDDEDKESFDYCFKVVLLGDSGVGINKLPIDIFLFNKKILSIIFNTPKRQNSITKETYRSRNQQQQR